MLLRAICGCVLLGILAAGLWPFHSPRNGVRWLSRGNGFLFSNYGSVVSAGSFPDRSSEVDPPCSVEIWLQPKWVHAPGAILAFYRRDRRVTPFLMRQSASGDLVLQRTSPDQPHPTQRVRIRADDLFGRQKPVLLSISANRAGTTIYADGVLVKTFADFSLSATNLTGQLILGNSPVTTDDWTGTLRGLAIYDRDLTAGEVSEHYADWTNRRQSKLAAAAVALYLFDEGAGNIVHNHLDAATDLLIPERFFILQAEFLKRPWDEFHQSWSYWLDLVINVAGFIPFGFCFYAYFSRQGRFDHPIAATMAFGFAVSMTIEVLQAFLPTRHSGMTDLITNTLGTALGAMALRLAAVQAALARAGLWASHPLPRPTVS